MDRDYEEFIQTLPKLAANWDRDAKPQKTERNPIPKPLKKPRTKKPPPEPVKKPAFEDVVFVTPPMTPAPQVGPIMSVKAENKRDDDFWEFYDKGLPPV